MQVKIPTNLPEPSPPPSTPPPSANNIPRANINWLWVLRDVVILFVATFAGSKIVGFTANAMNNATMMDNLSVINIVVMTFGFFIVAYLVRENRLRHFVLVSTLLWFLGSLPNVVFFNAPVATLLMNWLASAPLIAFATMVGGSAGAALFKAK